MVNYTETFKKHVILPIMPKWETKPYPYIALLALLFLIFVYNTSKVESTSIEVQKDSSIDTYIPSGFVLVPIQLENIDSLQSMFDRFGIIDLYSNHKGISKLLVKNIKILRAPKDPDHFAVLTPKNLVNDIISEKGKMIGVIQNSLDQKATKKNQTPYSRITYE